MGGTRTRSTAHRTAWLLGATLAAAVFVSIGPPCRAGSPATELPRAGIPVDAVALPTTLLPGVHHATASEGPRATGAPRAVPSPVREIRTGSRFVRGHLIPRLNRRFDRFDDRSAVAVLGFADQRSNAGRDLADLAARGAEKAASRALTDWIVTATDLERKAATWFGGRSRETDRLGTDRGRRASIGLGVSHALPRAEVAWEVGRRATFRVSILATGSAGIELRREKGRSERVWAGWNAEHERLGVRYRVAF